MSSSAARSAKPASRRHVPSVDDFFNPEVWPIAWMARAERQHARNSSALLKPLGLHHREFRLLAFLGRNPGIGIGELAEEAVLERPTVSKMVERLEAQGLLARGSPDGDRRRAPLTLTPEGARLLRKASAIVDGLLREYSRGMATTQYQQFFATVIDFYRRVREADPAKRPAAAKSRAPRRGSPLQPDGCDIHP